MWTKCSSYNVAICDRWLSCSLLELRSKLASFWNTTDDVDERPRVEGHKTLLGGFSRVRLVEVGFLKSNMKFSEIRLSSFLNVDHTINSLTSVNGQNICELVTNDKHVIAFVKD